MDRRTKDLFDSNFNFTFKASTLHNIHIALLALENFLQKNEKFFSMNKGTCLLGHLRSYAVERQFLCSTFNPQSNYSVIMKPVNNYGYQALSIETKDFIVSIGHTKTPYKLLSVSKYKKQYALSNADLDQQIRFDFPNDVAEIMHPKKYAQITYGYDDKSKTLTHLNILLPSSDYKNIEHSIDLLGSFKIYENYVPEKVVEESIITLKTELAAEVKS